MNKQRLTQIRDLHRDGLLHDTIPFWESHFIDKEHGGFLTYLDADGSVLSTDKPVWVVGRVAWMWSRFYNDVEQRTEWLEVARHGIDFMLKHCFDSDGRMYFRVTREGKPLIKRRYLFSETFGTIALAEYARATGSAKMLQKARDLFRLIIRYSTTPGLLPAKVNPDTRQLKSHAMPMILLATSQVLRKADPGEPYYDQIITNSMNEAFNDFMKPEKRCVLETVLADGSILDNPEGRTVNPGHAIETAWFILEEARHRGNDRTLIEKACTILDWSLQRGWDPIHGGIFYFIDCDGKQPDPYEHELKLWWPHNEALYALLLAYHLTGDEKWATWYERVHDWSFAHFPDRQHGEWFGYLRRDGSVSSTVKGNYWKGPFHLPRMQLYCWKLLEQMIA